MVSNIEETIRKKGYKGASSTIWNYTSKWKKIKNDIKENGVEEGKKKLQ